MSIWDSICKGIYKTHGSGKYPPVTTVMRLILMVQHFMHRIPASGSELSQPAYAGRNTSTYTSIADTTITIERIL